MYGFGAVGGDWGGFLSDLVRVPWADHMLVPLPQGLDPAAVASASDNIPDAWRTVGPPLEREPGAPVLIVGGAGAGSIGLYAAGIARALGSESVTYVDADAGRRATADGVRRRGPRAGPRAAGPVRDHRRRERRPGQACSWRWLDRPRRRLHQHRDLLRRAGPDAAVRDVPEDRDLRDRPGARAARDAGGARARGRRTTSAPRTSPAASSRGTTRPPRFWSATG